MAAIRLGHVFCFLLLVFNLNADDRALARALDDLNRTAAANDIREEDELMPVLKMNSGREFTDTFLPKFIQGETIPTKSKYLLQSATGYTEAKLVRFVATYVDGDYQSYTITLIIPRTKYREAAKFGLLDDYYKIEKEQSEGRKVESEDSNFKITELAGCLAVSHLPASSILTIRTKSCGQNNQIKNFIAALDLASLNRKLQAIINY